MNLFSFLVHYEYFFDITKAQNVLPWTDSRKDISVANNLELQRGQHRRLDFV